MNADPKSLELATREKIDRVLEAHSYDPTQIVGILLDVQGRSSSATMCPSLPPTTWRRNCR